MSDMQWRTIDSAPKDGTQILVYGPLRSGGFYHEVTRWYAPGKMGAGCWPVIWMDNYEEPTHWMPLPSPPSDNSDGQAGSMK